MQIKFHKDFKKDYKKLNKRQQERVKQSLALFQQNPQDRKLKNHGLKGLLKGRRSIAAGGDIRMIFEEQGKYTIVLFLRVGSHNQVY